EGVLPDDQGPPQSGWRGHGLRPALRERRTGGEERDRHVPRGVPERHDLRQHAPERWLRRRAAWPEWRREYQRRPDRAAARGSEVRAGVAVAVGDRLL